MNLLTETLKHELTLLRIAPRPDWLRRTRGELAASMDRALTPQPERRIVLRARDLWQLVARSWTLAHSACALAVLMGAGVWVSQTALPGDALYTYKRTSEQVALVLASNAQRASLHAHYAARRQYELTAFNARQMHYLDAQTFALQQSRESHLAALPSLMLRAVVTSDEAPHPAPENAVIKPLPDDALAYVRPARSAPVRSHPLQPHISEEQSPRQDDTTLPRTIPLPTPDIQNISVSEAQPAVIAVAPAPDTSTNQARDVQEPAPSSPSLPTTGGGYIAEAPVPARGTDGDGAQGLSSAPAANTDERATIRDEASVSAAPIAIGGEYAAKTATPLVVTPAEAVSVKNDSTPLPAFATSTAVEVPTTTPPVISDTPDTASADDNTGAPTKKEDVVLIPEEVNTTPGSAQPPALFQGDTSAVLRVQK